jgi:hypothetical protein
LSLRRRDAGFFYFAMAPSFKKGEVKEVTIDVEYFDDHHGALGLEFDDSKSLNIPKPASASASQTVRLTGSMKWQTATFPVRNGTFHNAQACRSDFRVWASPAELHVRRVTVTRGIKDTLAGLTPAPGIDFASSNTLSILLGEPDQEGAQGLFHIASEKDGLTACTNLQGTPCRYLTMEKRPWAYYYFILDRSFKQSDARNVDIEIESFDERPVTLNLEFDASKTRNIPNSVYATASPTVRLTGSGEWHTNTFQVRNATFGNAQNAGADFRLTVRPPTLHVRRVTVTRAAPDTLSRPTRRPGRTGG